MDSQQPPSVDELEQDQQVALFSISTVFPFRIFPTKISVDKKKIDIIHELFIGSKQIQSILIVDVMNVVVETNLFFAKLRIHDKLPMHGSIVVEYLPRAGALKMRRIIEGLLVGDRSHVDTSKVPSRKLASQMERIGRAKMTKS